MLVPALGSALIAALALLGATSTPVQARSLTTAQPAAATDRTAADVVWLCRPGIADNPCEIPLDTTLQHADGSATVATPRRRPARQRPVDCFYVYPTVSNQVGVNASKAKDPELYSIAKYQAARFSTGCRMFVPVYRQVPLAGLATLPLGLPKAYGDVRQAWQRYLERHNHGRGVILIGHSQGTIMLRQLLRDVIEPSRSQRRRLVGAILMGGNVTVARDSLTGGDFRRTPLCTRKGQHGCVVAYSTYSTDPLPASFFGNSSTDVLSPAIGHPSGARYEVACTDPGRLSGMTGASGLTVPSEPFAQGPIRVGISITAAGDVPTADTTWVRPPDRVRGRCRSINGAHVFRYEPTEGSRRLAEFPPLWGTHLVDVNLGLDKLVRIARLQTRSWLASR